MSEPMACGQCAYWRKHEHKSANWGTCERIVHTSFQKPGAANVYLSDGELITRDVFFCAEFVQKPQQQRPSLVDTVREAARSYHKRLKEQ